MSAITAVKAPQRYGPSGPPSLHNLDMAAATKILAGALVCKDASGNAVNASTATGLVAVGIATETIDNTTGAAGDQRIEVESGCWGFVNSSAGDLITKADLYVDVFIVDNQTVAKTNGTNTRSRAGQVERLEGGLVFVNINPLGKGV